MKKMILAIMTLTIIFSGCSAATLNNAEKEINDVIKSQADSDNKYVIMVKNGYRTDDPDLTYEEAFSDFFATPRWTYFKSDDDKDVVEFTGDCTYNNAPVKARIQFVVDEKSETFSAEYLAFNEVPQNELTLIALIEKVFSEYNAKTDETVSNLSDIITETKKTASAYIEQTTSPKADTSIKLGKNYSNKALEMSFDYPYEWELFEHDSKMGFDIYDGYEGKNKAFNAGITVSGKNGTEPYLMNSSYEEIKTCLDIAFSFTDTAYCTNISKTTFGGVPAIMAEYSVVIRGYSFKLIDYIYNTEKNYYQFMILYRDDLLTYYEPIVDEIVKSFIIIENEDYDKAAIDSNSDLSQTGIEVQGIVNIEEGYLNIRNLPSTDSYVVDTLDKGDKIYILGEDGDWYKIAIYNIEGYVLKDYIKIID